MRVIILLFFLNFVVSNCPSKEEREHAWNINKKCKSKDSYCCFDEFIMDPKTGNETIINCCYVYGTDGPVKCCGQANDDIVFVVVLCSVFAGGFALIFFSCFFAFIYNTYYGKKDETMNDNLQDCQVVNLNNIEL